MTRNLALIIFSFYLSSNLFSTSSSKKTPISYRVAPLTLSLINSSVTFFGAVFSPRVSSSV